MTDMNNETKKRGGFLLGTLKLLCVGAVSAACGLGGGWYAVTHFGTAGEEETPVVNTPVQVPVLPSTSATEAMTLREAAAKASPSVVEINVKGTTTSYGFFGGTYQTESAGSGVIVSSDGYIITNNHVVEGGNTFTITTHEGEVYEAELLGTDDKTDIAVLKVDAQDLVAATIGNSDLVQVGDTAIAIGNPLGTLGGTVTDGIISAVSRDIVINGEAMTLIQTNAQVNSGNSGGGLFDGNGNLVGIVNAKDSGSSGSGATIEGLGFAVPVNTAMDVAEQLILYGEVTNRASLGVQLQEVTRSTVNYPAGLYIVSVYDGTGAADAGLQKYDRIVSCEGVEISSYPELSAVLNKKAVGDSVTMEIAREGETMEVSVTLCPSSLMSTKE